MQHVTRMALAALLVLVVVAAALRGDSQGAVSLLDRPTAISMHWTLNTVGLPAELEETTLTHPAGFAARIEFTCTVLIPVLIIAAFLLALPIPASSAAAGIAAGILLLSVLNSLRLVGLYYVGVNFPGYFGPAHDWFGQGLIATAIVVYLACWTSRPGLSAKTCVTGKQSKRQPSRYA